MMIHESGLGGYWTGKSREISEMDGTPVGWFPGDMPELGEGEYARWAGFSAGWITTAKPPTPVSPTRDQVTAERDRRLQLDFEFAGVAYQRNDDAVRRINGAGTLALAAIVGGAQPGNLRWHGGDSDFVWIASDNSVVQMDAQTIMAFGAAAAAVETGLIFAAKAIKAMNPIPADFADDIYWPT